MDFMDQHYLQTSGGNTRWGRSWPITQDNSLVAWQVGHVLPCQNCEGADPPLRQARVYHSVIGSTLQLQILGKGSIPNKEATLRRGGRRTKNSHVRLVNHLCAGDCVQLVAFRRQTPLQTKLVARRCRNVAATPGDALIRAQARNVP